tara:strand:+ start:636 stop:950 length:315 start_codon:yes stop_codon:yes gene_type:complete
MKIHLSEPEINVIMHAAGWYDFNWYDKATNNLKYYLERWRCDKKSIHFTQKVKKTLDIIVKNYPKVTDDYDYTYRTLDRALQMFEEYHEYLENNTPTHIIFKET